MGQLDDYSPEEREKFFKSLEQLQTQRPEQADEQMSLAECGPPRAGDVEPEPDRAEEESVDPCAKRDKRLKSENTRSEALGSNPKVARERARAKLQSGYCVSTSGRNVKVLHRLGSCCMVPGVDYPRYVYTGRAMQQHAISCANAAPRRVQKRSETTRTVPRRRHRRLKRHVSRERPGGLREQTSSGSLK